MPCLRVKAAKSVSHIFSLGLPKESVLPFFHLGFDREQRSWKRLSCPASASQWKAMPPWLAGDVPNQTDERALWGYGVELKREICRISKNQLPMRVHGATKQTSEEFAMGQGRTGQVRVTKWMRFARVKTVRDREIGRRRESSVFNPGRWELKLLLTVCDCSFHLVKERYWLLASCCRRSDDGEHAELWERSKEKGNWVSQVVGGGQKIF
jgi:hypothetical protein